jgi:hypothetical protein
MSDNNNRVEKGMNAMDDSERRLRELGYQQASIIIINIIIINIIIDLGA